jgi:predicted ATPase
MGHVYQLLRLDIRALRRDNDVARESLLETTGGNLANVFATLDRGRQASLAKSFVQLVPVYGDVDVQPLPGAKGRHGLYFQDRWAPGVWYTSECVSDGSVLLLALLAVQYQTPPVELLAIEEPERGLHPYLFESVVKALRSISEPSSDRAATQVVLATHSPEILDYVLPHEVRFLDRDAADGSVRIDQPPSTSPDWEAKFDEYRRSLGEMWLAGAVGGVPGSP